MSQDRYEVLGKLAEGGLGSVFKAYDRNLRREVALKRVRADSPAEAEQQAEKLFAEARTISTLQHPHIVTVFDVGKDDEGAYLVMELLKGETLEDIIERGALNEVDFRELVTQSLEGMVAAHSTGLIHLDIKPQNFMVIWLPSGKFQIKILDFGLATIAHTPTLQEVDEEGAVMGSIYFMAPEQFERSPVDARTDLYSLGCVYYFALTQHYPFQGETGPEVMASHMYHSYIPLAQLRPDLPTFVQEWVEWLMNRLPDHRPESAALALEYFLAGAFAPPQQLGTVTSPLRPSAPRPTRPMPAVHRPGTQSQPVGHRPVPKPIARPVNIAAAAAPKHLKPKKAIPKWVTIGIPAGIVFLVVAVLGLQWYAQSQRDARFAQLQEMHPPSGGLSDVELLLRYIDSSDSQTSDVAAKVLGDLDLQGNQGANSLISSWIPRLQNNWAKKNIASVVAQRRIAEALDPMIKLLGKAKDTPTRLAIWDALARIADPVSISDLIDKMRGGTPDELRAASAAIVEVARRNPDLVTRGVEVLQAYRANSGNDDEQAELLRALCRIGNRSALPDILKGLTDPNTKLRYHAALGLSEWPTAEPMPALITQLHAEKDSAIRYNLIGAVGDLASLSGDVPQEEIAQALIDSYKNSPNDSRTQQQILSSLSHVAASAAETFLDEMSNRDPRRKAMIQVYVRTVKGALAKAVTLGDAETPLPAEQAFLTPGPLLVKNGIVINWFGLADQVGWLVKIDKPGEYAFQLTQASASNPPGRYLFTAGTQSVPHTVEATVSGSFRTVDAGRNKFSKPGLYRIWIRPVEIPNGGQLMQLKGGAATPGG